VIQSSVSDVASVELLDSVHQEVGEQRPAEEQEALGGALSPVTQVPLTT